MPASTCRRCIRPARRPRPTPGRSTPCSRPPRPATRRGNPFGIGLGTTEDNVDTAGAIFQSFGAALVDAKGTIKVKSDPVRQALEYYKKLAQLLPPDAPAWDNASNNKYLISGKGSLIMNPPSAWAVAKRDAPKVAEQMLDARHAVRPEGPLRAVPAVLLGHLELRQEQVRGQGACCCTCRAARRSRRWSWPAPATTCRRSRSSPRSRSWAEEGPPKGTLYHYPNPHNHQTLSVAAAPAPPKIAHQIYTQAIQTKMVVRFMQGEAMEKTLAWAESEIEGFMRT